MEARPFAALVSGARQARLEPVVVAALAFLAYLPLVREGVLLPGHDALERWLFRPSPLPLPLVLALSGWLLWRRRYRLRAATGTGAPLGAALLTGLGAALYVWALLTRAADLLLPALAAHGLALAAALRGRAGVRAALLPALVLLVGVPIPAPLRNELVWHLQLWTAAGAAWLLQSLGEPILHGGVVLRTAEHSFHVIDGCSGFAGIQILLLVALIVRELFASSGRRQWLLVLLAPGLGLLLNVVRIAYVTASRNPEALAGLEGSHTPQGVALLAAGTGVLYALGQALAWRAPGRVRDSRSAPEVDVPRNAPWRLAAVLLAVLAATSFALPPFDVPPAPSPRLDFPDSGAGWTSEALISNPYFIGAGLTADEVLHRRYRREQQDANPMDVVELFVGAESRDVAFTSRLLSSKLERPGPEWDVEKARRDRVWVLGRDADLVIASHPPDSERAVVYRWSLGDRGLWTESWRALLALDASPFRRRHRRRVVQLVAFAPHDGQLVIDRAKQRLDRFAMDFREELAAL